MIKYYSSQDRKVRAINTDTERPTPWHAGTMYLGAGMPNGAPEVLQVGSAFLASCEEITWQEAPYELHQFVERHGVFSWQEWEASLKCDCSGVE